MLHQWDQRADADPRQIGCYTRCNYRRGEIGRRNPDRPLAPIGYDAVLDRLVHTAHRLALDGETLRKPAEKSGKRSKLDIDNAA